MNVIKKLTCASILKNRKRSIATVIAVILSTALIVGTAGLAASAIRSFQNTAVYQVGDFHMTVENVPRGELPQITENKQVDNSFLTKSLGYAALQGGKNADKPYLYVYALGERALSGGWGLHLIEGRMPENENELAISAHIRSNARVPLKVGDTLTLAIGRRIGGDCQTLYQETAFEQKIPESLVTDETRSFTVVGVIERPEREIEPYEAPGYTCITYADEAALAAADPVNVSFTLKSAFQYDTFSKTLFENLSSYTGVIINRDLLEYAGALNDDMLTFIFTVSAVVLAIIMVTSVFVIRNSFAISVSEKNRQYGILASVGATSRQIRKSVLYEGLLFGLVGVPVGVGGGMLAVFVLLKIVNALIGSLVNGLVFVYWVPLAAVLVSVLLAAVTIFFSADIPARRAGKIAPIEAVRGNREVNVRAKEVSVSPLTKKLFGIGGVIAAKNLKRSRKKYRTTVISLVLSVTVFISMSSFVAYMKKSVAQERGEIPYNISVYPPDFDHQQETAAQYRILAEAAAADTYAWYLYNDAQCSLEAYGSAENKRETAARLEEELQTYDFGDENALTEEELRESYGRISIRVAAYDEAYFEEYLRSVGCAAAPEKAAVLVDIGGSMNVKAGQTVRLDYISDEGDDPFSVDFTVEKTVASGRPMGMEGHPVNHPLMVVSEKYFTPEQNEKLHWDISSLFLCTQDADAAEQRLLNLFDTDPVSYSGYGLYNVQSDADDMRRIILIAEIFLYGFIAVITLIGVTNIFNTITTNMNLRQKEFAMLKSVGMTKKEFNRMVRLESLLYGLKSLCIGIPLGIVGGAGFYVLFHDQFRLTYVFPAAAVALSAVFVFIIVGLTMRYSLGKINKQNIIETIRNENT